MFDGHLFMTYFVINAFDIRIITQNIFCYTYPYKDVHIKKTLEVQYVYITHKNERLIKKSKLRKNVVNLERTTTAITLC